MSDKVNDQNHVRRVALVDQAFGPIRTKADDVLRSPTGTFTMACPSPPKSKTFFTKLVNLPLLSHHRGSSSTKHQPVAIGMNVAHRKNQESPHDSD